MNRMDRTGPRANDAVVEALLERIHDQDHPARQRRVELALDATIRSQHPASKASRRTFVASRWLQTAAAALVFLTVVFWPGANAPSAIALVSHSAQAMRLPIDRRYALQIQIAGDPNRRIEGELHPRGDGRIAIRIDAPAGPPWMGEGRKSAWIVPPARLLPVILRPSGSTFRNTLLGTDGTRLPVLDIAGMLGRLHENHELEALQTEESVIRVRATLGPESTRPDAPHLVEMTARKDGTVLMLVLSWNDRLPIQAETVRLTFLDDPDHDEEFYEYANHHDGRRIVDRR